MSRLYHYTIFITFKVQQKHFDTIQKEKVCYSKRSVGHRRYHSGVPWGVLPLLYWPGESTAVLNPNPVCSGDISATILCRSRICINICQMFLLVHPKPKCSCKTLHTLIKRITYSFYWLSCSSMSHRQDCTTKGTTGKKCKKFSTLIILTSFSQHACPYHILHCNWRTVGVPFISVLLGIHPVWYRSQCRHM